MLNGKLGYLAVAPASFYCGNTVGSEVFETVIADGEWRGEVQFYPAGGRVLDILLRAYALFDEAGLVQGLVGVHTVITEHKKVEETIAAKASLERIISQASRRFLTLAELDTSINACLADIGRRKPRHRAVPAVYQPVREANIFFIVCKGKPFLTASRRT